MTRAAKERVALVAGIALAAGMSTQTYRAYEAIGVNPFTSVDVLLGFVAYSIPIVALPPIMVRVGLVPTVLAIFAATTAGLLTFVPLAAPPGFTITISGLLMFFPFALLPLGLWTGLIFAASLWGIRMYRRRGSATGRRLVGGALLGGVLGALGSLLDLAASALVEGPDPNRTHLAEVAFVAACAVGGGVAGLVVAFRVGRTGDSGDRPPRGHDERERVQHRWGGRRRDRAGDARDGRL